MRIQLLMPLLSVVFIAGCQQQEPQPKGLVEEVSAKRVVAQDLAAQRLMIMDSTGTPRIILDSDDPDGAIGASITMFDKQQRVKMRITEGSIGNRISLSDPEGRPRITIDVFQDGRITFAPAEGGAGGWFIEENSPLRD